MACWDNGVTQQLDYFSTGVTESLLSGNGSACLQSVSLNGDPRSLTWTDGTGTEVATGVLEQPDPYSYAYGTLEVTCLYDGITYAVDLDSNPDCAGHSDTSWRVSYVCDYGSCP
jgi:hypothetical protein